jgi:hypothetical protein
VCIKKQEANNTKIFTAKELKNNEKPKKYNTAIIALNPIGHAVK